MTVELVGPTVLDPFETYDVLNAIAEVDDDVPLALTKTVVALEASLLEKVQDGLVDHFVASRTQLQSPAAVAVQDVIQDPLCDIIVQLPEFAGVISALSTRSIPLELEVTEPTRSG